MRLSSIFMKFIERYCKELDEAWFMMFTLPHILDMVMKRPCGGRISRLKARSLRDMDSSTVSDIAKEGLFSGVEPCSETKIKTGCPVCLPYTTRTYARVN